MKISPSTLKRAKCRRRVIAEKWGGYSEPFGKAASFGTDVHAVGEAWMKQEADVNPATPAGRLFLEILPHVPSRDLDAERYLTFTADGVTFHGYIDFGGWATNPDTGLHELVFGDYKTSSRPWDYGLSDREKLLEDEQVNIYGLAEMLDYGSQTARPFWLYADTSKSRYAYTQGGWDQPALTYMQVEDYMADNAIPRARDIRSDFAAAESVGVGKDLPEHVKLEVINSVPCNPVECDYRMRNCGFRKHCDLFSEVTFVETKEQTSMSTEEDELNAIIAARKARAKKVAVEEEVPAKVAEAATPAEPKALPPEAAPVLEQAVAERTLPPEEQSLGRKASEKLEKAEAKVAEAEEKAAKKAAKAAPKTQPKGVDAEVAALRAALGVECEVWVKL